MGDETVYEAIIDREYEDYKSFFDHAWARRLMQETDGTSLEVPVFELGVHWRTLANTHAMPWILVQSLGGLWKGVFDADGRFGFARRLAMAMRDNIIGSVDLNLMKQQQVTAVMNEAAAKFAKAEEAEVVPPFPQEELWADLRDSYEFQMAIMGSQRCCFGSLYHSYENFIRRVLGVLSKTPDYRIGKFPQFQSDVRQYLGNKILDECILDARVNIARLARNCLAHADGKESEELKKAGHPFLVANGNLQIMAVHTADLFRILRGWVNLIVAEALSRLAVAAGAP